MQVRPLPQLSAKAEDILDIIGNADNGTIDAILQTGASIQEIRKAFEQEEEEEYIGESPDGPEGRTKLVYKILKDDRAYHHKSEEDDYDY